MVSTPQCQLCLFLFCSWILVQSSKIQQKVSSLIYGLIFREHLNGLLCIVKWLVMSGVFTSAILNVLKSSEV